MVIHSGDDGALDPMVNCRCIPGLSHDFLSPGWVVGRSSRQHRFNLESIKRTGPGGDGFLTHDLRVARPFHDISVSGVDLVGLKTPARADFERRLNSRPIVGLTFPRPGAS